MLHILAVMPLRRSAAHVASWKIMPRVWRWPLRRIDTPWRMVIR
jgi:hypothetical protein